MRTRQIYSIIILIILFILFLIFLYPKTKTSYVKEIISPCEILLSSGQNIKFDDVEWFDDKFSTKNKKLAKDLHITEKEAFILGNLGRYWTKNILEGRKISLIDNNLTYHKFNYKIKLMNSAFCIKDNKYINPTKTQKIIDSIQYRKYKLYDMDNGKFYEISSENIPKNFILVSNQDQKYISRRLKNKNKEYKESYQYKSNIDNYKLIISDLSRNLKPTTKCSDNICKEILFNINNCKNTLDIAIYGYSSVPEIENAITKALQRGVKIRLVHDIDAKGQNIYKDTNKLATIIKNINNDRNSIEYANIMHNKFYIFDKKIVITGSANLSSTDMSGFNSNSIIVINSKDIAEIYTREFSQMYQGKFHNEKTSTINDKNIYFSPQDKGITKGILPLIRNAKHYIFIPTFIITEKRITEELINAHKRGVEIKLIADALNAPKSYSKVNELRTNGIQVKIENYAGKMHSKTMIIDDKFLVIGSMNFSNSGENKNDENFIIINNSTLVKNYKNFFNYLWEKIPNKWLKYYPKAEGQDSIGSCNDGIDNDYDGLIDSEEASCKSK